MRGTKTASLAISC